MKPAWDIAPAKLNLALHVRSELPDGRHAIETVFAFCTDGDVLTAEPSDDLTLDLTGPFARELDERGDNLVMTAARRLAEQAGVSPWAALRLEKRLPVASGIGGGSADAAAALRLLTAMWRVDPRHATVVAPQIGSDVPACLLSLPMRGEGAGDALSPIDLSELSGTPVLLVNPGTKLRTADVFAGWSGVDLGPLKDWKAGRNDLEPAATAIVPEIADVLAWLSAQAGARLVRMSGSGATCFAFFDDEGARDKAEAGTPSEWWRLPTFLR